ncbi:hypothetical protein CEP45_04030 [Mergibacter septicus]|uniref:hypothetical protein n=1 Tax=Mergibacter septicus TaxID=221402 RepID=UPI001C7729DD|nr:hypothetical protein [Mergibacter septicus]QDJ13069.1 hypothetical protein CEP45_04030 [Mergibacter septicus]
MTEKKWLIGNKYAKKDITKKCGMSIRCTTEQRDKIKQFCIQKNVSITDLFINLVMKEIEKENSR